VTAAADINAVCPEVEAFLATYKAGGLSPVEAQVRPSGDDADVIKVWVDLGAAGIGTDAAAWGDACEAAIRAAVPSVAGFRVQVRVETGA
jgi:hypothetical protein